ncbi:MAG: hypothetical protein GY777_12675 [Candidatus Brocadiaceae bacterium]|nr:hypothetical protein [Candidatus Brocadiaceae bacterium]
MKKIFVILTFALCISCFMQCSFLKDADAKLYSEHEPAGKAGLVAASVVSSAAYIPCKAVYAALGGVTCGLTYVVSMAKESETANRIAKKSFTGDWYIHPNILTSHEELNFSGPDDINP